MEFDGIEFPDKTKEINVEFKDKENEQYFKKSHADYNELINGNGSKKE